MPQLKLEKCHPSSWEDLSREDSAFMERLPSDYRSFLGQNNGGFVAHGSQAAFDIPIERRHEGKVSSICEANEVEEFFSLIPSRVPYERRYGEVPASLLHEHWGRHADEGFLPKDVVVFAGCTQSCLLALSLNTDDFGSVYYWEWYWRYPWFAEFFNRRIARAKSRFKDVEHIISDESHSEYAEAFNALNYATLIKVADSFSGFLDGLHAAEEDA